jgi:Transposase IS200 like.
MKESVRVRSRGYLPHWEVDNGIYFMTYRLADSLPDTIVARLRQERKTIRRQIAGDETPNAVQRAEIDRLFVYRLDAELDRGFGKCHLRNPRIAALVVENLRHFDGERYRMFAYAGMPNHVHVLLQLFNGADLDRLFHSWKSYTSHRALEIVNATAPFWQKEYFDRLVRDERDFVQTRTYILENPAKAGLKDWEWVWAADA